MSNKILEELHVYTVGNKHLEFHVFGFLIFEESQLENTRQFMFDWFSVSPVQQNDLITLYVLYSGSL